MLAEFCTVLYQNMTDTLIVSALGLPLVWPVMPTDLQFYPPEAKLPSAFKLHLAYRTASQLGWQLPQAQRTRAHLRALYQLLAAMLLRLGPRARAAEELETRVELAVLMLFVPYSHDDFGPVLAEQYLGPITIFPTHHSSRVLLPLCFEPASSPAATWPQKTLFCILWRREWTESTAVFTPYNDFNDAGPFPPLFLF